MTFIAYLLFAYLFFFFKFEALALCFAAPGRIRDFSILARQKSLGRGDPPQVDKTRALVYFYHLLRKEGET
jgi:hypothetical protein